MLRQLPRDAQRATARDDRDLVHRVGLRQQLRDHRVARLVIGGCALRFLADHGRLALRTHEDLVLRVLEVLHLDDALATTCGEQRGLVHEVREIGAREARRAACDDCRVDVVRDRHLAQVHAHDLLAAADIRQADIDLAVETARTQQRLVEHVGTVGGGDHDHAGIRLETVHLDEHLVQRLLALVVAAAHAGAAMTADRVDFVDEHDARRMLLRLLEHVAHTGRADADEHFDEVRTRDAEERHLRFTRDRAGEQRLAGTRRADQQHAARNATAQFLEFLRIAQEVDELGHFFLRFVAARDVGEVHRVVVFVDQPRTRFPERERAAFAAPLHLPHHVEPEHDDQDRRPEVVQRGHQRVRLVVSLAADLHAVLHQIADHPDVAGRHDLVFLAISRSDGEVAPLNDDVLDLAVLGVVHELRIGHAFLDAGLVELLEHRKQHQCDHQPHRCLRKHIVVQSTTPSLVDERLHFPCGAPRSF